MPGPEECFESKQALNARFRESNRNISPIEKDYHTNLKECKNDILFIAYDRTENYERDKYEVLNCDGEVVLSDGKLRETQKANYFSNLCSVDCAVLSVKAQSCRKYCAVLP